MTRWGLYISAGPLRLIFVAPGPADVVIRESCQIASPPFYNLHVSDPRRRLRGLRGRRPNYNCTWEYFFLLLCLVVMHGVACIASHIWEGQVGQGACDKSRLDSFFFFFFFFFFF